MRRALIGIITLTLGVALGCNRLHTKAAVEQAIQAHLHDNPHLSMENFTIEVKDVQFSGNTAQALVEYRSKTPPVQSVKVRYGLQQQGDHWVVASSMPMSGQGEDAHSSQDMNPNAPAMPAAPAPQPQH
jgi:hypothetical protein